MCIVIGLADQPRQGQGDSVEVLPDFFHRAERDAKTAPLRYKIISYVSAQQGVHCGHGIIKRLSFPSNVAMPLADYSDPLEAAPAIEVESSVVRSQR